MTARRTRLACSIAAAGFGLASAPPAAAAIPVRAAMPAAAAPAAPLRHVVRIQRAAATAERFATAAGETLEILFADGTSLTLGPRSGIVIDRFQWDTATRTGAFRATIADGRVRVVGGGVTHAGPILLTTPGAALALGSGGAFVDADALGTRAVLLIAGELRVTVGRRTRKITRPGFAVTVAQDRPSAPRRQRPEQAYADAVAINPGLAAGGSAHVVNDPAADRGDASAPAPTLSPGSLDQVANGQPSLGLPTTGTIASNGNVVGNPLPPGLNDPTPLTTPSFDAKPVVQTGSTGLALTLPSTGPITANGNGNTGDNMSDVLLAQNFAIGPTEGATPRGRALYASRLVPAEEETFAAAGRFTVRSGTSGIAALQAYGFSSGIALDADDASSIAVSVDTMGAAPATATKIRFDGLIYTAGTGADANAFYLDPANPASDKIVRTGSTFSIDFGKSFESLFFIGTDASYVQGDGSFRGAGIVLPTTVFGGDDAVKTTPHLTQHVLAKSSLAASKADFDAFVAGRQPKTYADYANLQRDFYALTPLDLGSDTSYAAPVDLTVRTIQAGFPIAAFSPADGSRPTRAVRAADNFLYVEATDNLRTSPLFGQTIVYATGDVSKTTIGSDGRAIVSRRGGASIDTFALVPGLAGVPDDVRGVRAFLPAESVPAAAAARLASTPLTVANPGTTAPAAGAPDLRIDTIGSRAFQADLALSADGRASTISATIGRIDYATDIAGPGGGAADRTQVTLTGRTVGASRADKAAPTLYTSPVVATASGGGRVWNTGTAAQPVRQTRPGYAGYFVLENSSDPAAADGSVTANGKAETLGAKPFTAPAGAVPLDTYGYVRVLAGDASVADGDAIGNGLSAHADGYVAGVLERADASGRSASPYVGSIGLDFDAIRNEMAAAVTYTDPSAAGGTRRVVLGGIGAPAGGTSAPPSAYVNAGTFGAVAATNRAAIVAGEAVKAGLGDAKIATYQYVRWGFFFGDTAGDASGDRTHAALSTWAAGERFDPASCGAGNCGIQGTARYTGHAIGNVLTGDGTIYTAIGSFDQSWDLTARAGTMNLAFDKASYATRLATTANTLSYAGTSTINPDGSAARIAGELVTVPAGGGQPRGTIGQFEIRGAGTGVQSYQASGTFAGDVTR